MEIKEEENRKLEFICKVPVTTNSVNIARSGNNGDVDTKTETVPPGTKLLLDEKEACRLESFGAGEIINRPKIESPEETAQKEEKSRLQRMIDAAVQIAIAPLISENKRLKEELGEVDEVTPESTPKPNKK